MPYDNRQRQESARSTRASIIEVAKASFLARGFGGTTIRQVAEDAGVSQETIYKTFGGKAALLKSVYDVSLAGDDEEIPLAGRPEAIAVRDATSPAAAATAYAELAQLISSRIDPLLRVLLGARDTDKALAEFARTTEKERHVGSCLLRAAVGEELAGSVTTSRSSTRSTPSGPSTHRSPAGCCSTTAGATSSTRGGSPS